MENKIQSTVINLATKPTLHPDALVSLTSSDIIPFGSDNLFPQAIALITRSSPNHRGVLNSKTNYMVGNGLETVDENEIEALERANNEEETLTDVVEKLIFDKNMVGNAYCEIITDKRRSFLYFNHLDATKIRKVKDSNMLCAHPAWALDTGKGDPRRQYLPLYPTFAEGIAENGARIYRSVYHFKSYEPEFVNYGIPVWIAGKDSAEIDLKTNKWNLARLENSFRVSGILVIPVSDESEGKNVINRIQQSNIGEGKQAKLLTIAKTRARENEKADTTQLIETKQDDDGSWINLHSQSLSDVVVSHGWYRSLSGIADNTGFDTQRILNEYTIALNTTIKKEQRIYTTFFNRVLRDQQGIQTELKFINQPPLNDFSYHYIWEAREQSGLEADKTKPEQNIIILPK